MKNKLQDKFEDFGSIPSNDVWAEIERQLNQKRKRKALIFWFSSGIAACLVGLVLLITFKTKENVLASRAKKTNFTSSKEETNVPVNSVKIDTLLVEKENLTETNNSVSQKNKHKSNSTRKQLRTKYKNINQDNFSDKLTDLSHQFEEKNKDILQSDSSNVVVQKQIEKKDSLAKQDSLDSTENNLTNQQNIPKKDSIVKRSKWSLEFGLATWDAFKNKDQVVTSNSSSNGDAESTFWTPPTTNQLNASSSSNSLASIYKPLSFTFGLNYKTNKNWLLCSGVNFDYMMSKTLSGTSISESNFISFGIPLGVGFVFRSDKRVKFIPKLYNISDFMFFQSEPIVTAINPTSDPILNSNTKKLGYQNSFQMDLNLCYELSAKSQFFLSPNFKYYVAQKLNLGNTQILKRDFWYGIKIGYIYNF